MWVQRFNYVDFDVKTITAGDYTVEINILPSVYNKFLDTYKDPSNPMTENAQFKLYFQNEFEDRINHPDFPDQGYDDIDSRDYRKKIAQITFAY